VQELGFVKAVEVLESADILDPIVEKADGLFSRLLQKQELRDLLHGVPIGHPLHPMAVQVPLGAFVSSAVLDIVPGAGKASKLLIGFGVLSALPAVAAGWADWLKLHEQQKRVGIVHAASNAAAIALYTASFVQRSRGKQASGRLLALAGFSVLGIGGYLGGHLAYRQAAGANHAEDVPHLFPTGWQPLSRLDELVEGELTRIVVADQPLLVHRTGERIQVLSNTCSHLSGPLDEGNLIEVDSPDGGASLACVECPWHQSVFSLETGEVVHGPATSPQPKFETRVNGDLVEVMLPDAG
jgi:nitrite reductase/ring-hydroxylating ferredoxin subunit/uncharacterized membrane protein